MTNTNDQTETTSRLMRRLAASLVSWLTIQQSALRSRMYGEHWMYALMYEVASARHWKVWPQFPLSNSDSTRYVDFVFYRKSTRDSKNAKVAAVEMSYIRAKNKVRKVTSDEEKLREFNTTDFFNGNYGKLEKYIVLTGKENDLRKYCSGHLKKAMVLLTKRKPPSKLGWAYFSPNEFKKDGVSTRWCVLALRIKE